MSEVTQIVRVVQARQISLIAVAVISLGGCNIVPPLDCLAGAGRPGCTRDANGQYQYLYKSALTPNGIYDAPSFAPSTATQSLGSTQVYKGRIDGNYEGWQGSSIYTLADGHVIRQSEFHYHYHFAYSPEIVIYGVGPNVLKAHVVGDGDNQDVAIEILR